MVVDDKVRSKSLETGDVEYYDKIVDRENKFKTDPLDGGQVFLPTVLGEVEEMQEMSDLSSVNDAIVQDKKIEQERLDKILTSMTELSYMYQRWNTLSETVIDEFCTLLPQFTKTSSMMDMSGNFHFYFNKLLLGADFYNKINNLKCGWKIVPNNKTSDCSEKYELIICNYTQTSGD